MGKTGKGPGTRFCNKLFSPLYIAIMLVAVIITGNFFNWADTVYGTHLNSFSPLLVILTVVLFAIYVYRVFRNA